ncbi:MAG: hypothetical protein ABGY24_15810 [bacterium]|jgi:hypothetical protein
MPRPKQAVDWQNSQGVVLQMLLVDGIVLGSQLDDGASLPSGPTQVTFLDCIPPPQEAEHSDQGD